MSDLTLGTAVVSIGGDINPLLEAFKKAKSARDAFERDMVSSSGGMLKFTAAANDAGTALDKQGAKAKTTAKDTTAAAASVDKLTEANKRTAQASKEASAALETEAQKNERVARMVDASIAKLNERNRLSASGSIKSVLPGGGANWQEASAAQNALMNKRGVGLPAELMPGAAVAGASAATGAFKAEAAAVEAVTGKLKVNSTAMREIVTLAREMGRQDFTRMAGSASILAQNLGLVAAVGAPLIIGLTALAAVTAVVGIAFVHGAKDANQFANKLASTGNYAGLTASSYENMAEKIAKATHTSIGSNKALILSLASTNKFHTDEIEALVTASQKLSDATGQSADDILKDFIRMADGPTKYAEAYQLAHIGKITPIQLDHIKRLEKTGETEQALAALIKIVTGQTADDTITNTNTISGAWNRATVAVSDFYNGLKRALTGGTRMQEISDLTKQIDALDYRMNSPLNKLIGLNKLDAEGRQNLVSKRAALQALQDTEDKETKAKTTNIEAINKQDLALSKIDLKYQKSVDNQKNYRNALVELNNTLADAVKMPHGTDVSALLSAASKSGIDSVVQLGHNYKEQVALIKKENLPDVYKADAKAASAAASEAKKLANEQAALEKRREQAIAALQNEAATLDAIVPLYKNQTMTLDEINKAKAITTKLTETKTKADTAEGKAIAELVGHNYDQNKVINDETKARQELESIRDKTASIELETKLIGLNAGALVYEQVVLEGLAKAKRENRVLTDEQTASLHEAAKAQAAATDALTHGKFMDDVTKSFHEQAAAIGVQVNALGMGRQALAAYTEAMGKFNKAESDHVTLGQKDILAIKEQSAAYAQAVEALNKLDEAQSAANWSVGQFEDAITNAIYSGKSFLSVLSDLVSAFAKASTQALLFGNGPLAGMFGKSDASTGGQGGGILGGLFHKGANSVMGVGGKESDALLATASTQAAGALQILDAAAQRTAMSIGAVANDNIVPLAAGADKATQAFLTQAPAVNQFGTSLLQMLSGMAGGGGGGGGIFGALLGIGISAIGGGIGGGGGAGAAGGSFNLGSMSNRGLVGSMGIPGYAGGGKVRGPGSGTSDSIFARMATGGGIMVSNGEFVTNAMATRKYQPLLEMMNSNSLPSLPGMFSNDNAKQSTGRPIMFGDIHVNGVSDERQGRMVAKQISSTLRSEIALAAKKGYGA